MKQALIILIIAALLIMPPPARAQIVVSDYPPELTNIDKQIDLLWDKAIIQQEYYFKMTGHYFQGLETTSKTPDLTAAAYPDNWFSHPADQQYRWADIGILPFDSLTYSSRINVYAGPEGSGWVWCYRVLFKDALWEKCRNYGPEALEAHDWEPIKQDMGPIKP